MIILILVVFGFIFGSFVEALIWRLHEQEQIKEGIKGSTKSRQLSPKHSALNSGDLSIIKGRSMCAKCGHQLSMHDLVPVLSWVELRGKCRYCHQSIGWQAPFLEITMAFVFVASYIWWPMGFNTTGLVNFIAWLVILVGLIALIVYDARWLILPNRIVYPLLVLAIGLSLYNLTIVSSPSVYLRDLSISVLIGGGLFYILFQISKGKWIGGGDVKLGALIGILLASPTQAFLVLFLASLLGTLVILPGLLLKRIKTTSHIPFGPFLIIALIIIKLFGASLISWYKNQLMLV